MQLLQFSTDEVAEFKFVLLINGIFSFLLPFKFLPETLSYCGKHYRYHSGHTTSQLMMINYSLQYIQITVESSLVAAQNAKTHMYVLKNTLKIAHFHLKVKFLFSSSEIFSKVYFLVGKDRLFIYLFFQV